MTWIRTRPLSDPEIAGAMKAAMAGYPPDYSPTRRHLRKLPPLVMRDSIVLSHSLIPEAMRLVFSGYGAMLDPALPLSRRQHELIALSVSVINDCYF